MSERQEQTVATVEVAGYGGGFIEVTGGQYVRITDIVGGQIGDLFAVSAKDHYEFLSPSVTRLNNLTLFPKIGQSFYSNKNRPILAFIEDHSPGPHDMLMASCNRKMFEDFGMEDHPNCRDNYFKAAAEAGIAAVIQPGGSVRDEEVIAAADEHGITMVFTGERHFRH